MIRSMTGYGRKEVTGATAQVAIEVRSVNNRFLDVQVKTPRSFAVLEPRVKKAVQKRFSRGRFDVFITRNGERERTGRLALDEALADQYITILRDLKTRFGLAGEVDLSLAARYPDLITVAEDKEDIETVWQMMDDGLAQALDELDGMRRDEGAALVKDLLGRLDTIETLMREIRTLSPICVENSRKRMADTLGRLLNEQPDPARLAQEIAILAERTDVTEELTRLSSHLVQFRAMLAGAAGEPVGRKLDFLLQEMGREANTISSKAMDTLIAYHVVNIKAEIEKIREQAQNIE
jgi:uncharacterized protein (TIGR00255 family)